MRLTSEQVAQFERDGYLFFPGLFGADEIKALNDAVPPLYSRREAFNVREKGSDAVRTNFKLIKMYAEDARKAYGPYLQGNKELVAALSIDLSPAGMSSLAPAMDVVAANGQALKQRIAAIQNALGNIVSGFTTLKAGTDVGGTNWGLSHTVNAGGQKFQYFSGTPSAGRT